MVVMTPNPTLLIPNALKRERPEDYYKNTTTIDWPLGPSGEAFPIEGRIYQAVVFKGGGHMATAKELVRFLVAEGWLMHYLDFSGERMLPSIPALLDSPFWLDPSDRHHMAAAMQAATRPLAHFYTAASGDLGHNEIYNEGVWAKAIHRIVTEGISPSRRSTRRSPASSRSWRSDGTSKARPSTHLRSGAKPSFSAPFAPEALSQRTLWD